MSQIVVVGGGPIGASLALRLSRSFTVSLLDAAPRPSPTPPLPDIRTFAITPSSAALLEALGVWRPVVDAAAEGVLRSTPFVDMQVWDSVGTACLRFGGGGEALGTIVEHGVMQEALAEALDASPVTTMYGTKLGSMALPAEDGGGVVLTTTDGDTIDTQLVVGADGGNSAVRRLAGMGTWGWAYDSKAVVATVETNEPHNTAWQRFLPDGPVAMLPLWGRHSSIIWSTTPEHAAALQAMEPAEFVDALNTALNAPSARASPDHVSSLPPLLRPLAAVTESATTVLSSLTRRHAPYRIPPHVEGVVGGRASFPLALAHVNSYVKPGLALAGDAAHTTHPLAGQGMNLGFADAACLADTLERDVAAGGTLGSITALQQYEAERRLENIAMINGLDVIKRVFASGDESVLGLLRDVGVSAINAADPVKDVIMRFATGRR